MGKILTVSVAAYNVADFLHQTLDSCIVAEIMDDLEVLIVNDGSRDETAAIAKEYQERYPDTFRLINKKNGGYGSTVNHSMKEAKGKYFKLLDGDDFFDQAGLKRLVNFLRNCEADLVLSGRKEVNETGESISSDSAWKENYGTQYHNQIVKIEQLKPFVFGMWVVTYRTKLLREHPFNMPEHQLYTDRLFVCYPLPWIQTVAFQNYDVYCYRIGHEGQSVSLENRIRHSKDTINGFEILLDIYENRKSISKINEKFLELRLARYFNYVLQTILLLPASINCQKEIKRLDTRISSIPGNLYIYCGEHNNMLSKFRKYTYALYWIRKLRKVKNYDI